MAIHFKLDNLPRRIQVVILACMAVGLMTVAYLFYFRDMLETRRTLEAEIVQLEMVVAQATAIETQLGQFKRDLAALDVRLQELRRVLPDQKETPDVLRNVQLMAAESNLKIVKFVPQPVAQQAFYVNWPITMEVQGSYRALGSFFEKIGRFVRIVNVDNISIKGIEGSTDPLRTLNSTCTATTFVYRDEAGSVPADADAAGKKAVPARKTQPAKGATPRRGTVPGN